MNQIVRAPLDGEVIGPADCARLIVKPSPFATETETFEVPAAMTVAEIVEAFVKPVADARHGWKKRVVVRIGGETVPEEFWPRVRAKRGQLIEAVVLPGKGAFQLIRTIAFALVAIVAAAVAPYLLQTFLPGLVGTLAGAAVKSLIALGISAAGPVSFNLFKRTPRCLP
ncbi:MAG: hypothetical protein BGP06_12225 [Rhizobiales bacterium 65-9]|nr:hypothetical protein [Hyphomicrobiales bacterium]OJY37172.1 MAG: hypothetical protein BGP06_12225 [Rhizobiales bacterium 65-9]